MLLAVAGLDKESMDGLTRRLGSRDWSSFSPAERFAFALARKQARTPWLISADDVCRLVDHFGHRRAIDVLWWSCRCHYMTRVADAFQLPLEKENVFADR